MADDRSTITFSRRRKDVDLERHATADSLGTTVASFVTAESVLTPLAETPDARGDVASTADSGAAAKGQRRKLAPPLGRARAATHVQHIAELKSYFDEVDAFQLIVETPTPKKTQRAKPAGTAGACLAGAQAQENLDCNESQQLPQAASSALKMRPMSLGLSRRSSSVALPRGLASARKSGRPSHLRPSSFGLEPSLRSTSHPGDSHALELGMGGASNADHERRVSAVADNMGDGPTSQRDQHSLPVHRRQSAAARASMTGQMLSRLSLGLSDALQWLGIRGSLPTAHLQPEASMERSQPSVQAPLHAARGRDAGDMSPICEEPASSSPALPVSVDTSPITGQLQPSSSSAAMPTPPQPAPATSKNAEPAVQQPAPSAGPHDGGAEPDEEQPADAPACSKDDVVAALGQQLQAKLDLADPLEGLSTLTTTAPEEELTPLQQLLVMCGQELDAQQLPSMDALLGQHVDMGQVRKIGEGTFGEAFKAGRVVFKIVPMEGQVLVNGEVQKRAGEILAEAAITLTLSGLRESSPDVDGSQAQVDNVTAGFVETFGVGVCRGQYAALLQKEWHRWDEQFGSENDPVDIFSDDQLFVVFVVADGGLDLEHYEIRSFKELRSILMQVCLTLAVAEEGCEFEHRDLHWGNLLIQRDGSGEIHSRLRGCDIKAHTSGVTVTLIDFTLSRLLTAGGEAVFCNLAADPELFKGAKGDVQAETYRRMKKATKNKWEGFCPTTNCLWMHYLADICLSQKLHFACSSCDKHELRNFRKRAMGYSNCSEMLWDEFFSGSWVAQ